MKHSYSTGKRRIAIVTETYPPEVNGVARTTGAIVRELSRRGHSVQLIRPRQRAHEHSETEPAINTVLVRGMPLPRYAGLQLGLPAGRLLRREWSARRPDIVQVVTEGPLGASAIGAARRLGIPVLSEFHTNFQLYSQHYRLNWLGTTVAAYLRRLHRRADGTLVPTPQMKEELARQAYARLHVVGRGIDTARFHPDFRCAALRRTWQVGDREPVALYVGRVAAEKNLPLFVEAVDAMRMVSARLRVVIVGDGPALGALRASRPDYIYAGMRSGEDLARHYASADMFIFPSLTETFGNVTTEAMASGLAVLAFDYGAARLYIRHRHNGFLAQRDDAAEFVELAQELAADPTSRARLRTAAWETTQTLSWERVVDDLEGVFRQIIRQSAAPLGALSLPPATRTDHAPY